jgi:hypothetical protein
MLATVALLAAGLVSGDTLRAAPFETGETLVFRGTAGLLGEVGTGTMTVRHGDPVRGHEVLQLGFDFTGRVALFNLRDRTCSWVQPGRMTALRFHKEERHPLGGRVESVEIFPEERRWVPEGGESEAMRTVEPLDELSFLFFVRTLDLEPGTLHVVDRHFDPERSPVVIRSLRRDTVDVPAGRFPVTVVEMLVKDPRRFRGEGRVVLHLMADSTRTPVRIESAMPGAGTMVLSLLERRPGATGAGNCDSPEWGGGS